MKIHDRLDILRKKEISHYICSNCKNTYTKTKIIKEIDKDHCLKCGNKLKPMYKHRQH